MSMTSFWCLYFQLWTDFAHCYYAFIVDFEQVNADWDGHISGIFLAYILIGLKVLGTTLWRDKMVRIKTNN